MDAATGMTGFVSAVGAGVTQDALWGTLTAFVPLLITMVLFAFGYKVVKKVIRGTSRGKASI